MRIFVPRASDCLTNHLSHGEGLICHSLLDGLARRGHTIFAATGKVAIEGGLSPNFHPLALPERLPANSLRPWERAWQADRWISRLLREGRHIDLVWLMNPCGPSCPYPPRTNKRPLVLGPLYSPWPSNSGEPTAKPRYGVGLKRIMQPLYERGWRNSIERASMVICSTDGQATLLNKKFTSTRFTALPLIVEPPYFQDLLAPKSQYAHTRPLRLAFVGHLAPRKNPQLFIEIVDSLRSCGVPTSAVVIGEGPVRHSLENWCAERHLASEVRFVGAIPNSDVFLQVSEADLLVSTSFGEPYGRNIVEAMSVGTPAICHRSGGPADFIVDKVDGVLVDSLDPKKYAIRIIELLRNGTLSALGTCARLKAQAWRSDPIIDRLETLLNSVIAAPK